MDHGVAVWSSASWRERAVAWLDAGLAAAGIERTGDVEQPRVRPWATVLRAPTTQGLVWLKAAAPGTAFEVGLYELLHTVAPEHVLAPIAADTDRGWIVLPDGGLSLAECARGAAELVDSMMRVLPMYGQLQRDVAPHAEAMVRLGVVDMRAEVMPQRFDEAMDAAREYVEWRGDAGDRATYERAAAMRHTFVSWCARLAAAPGLPSIDHNDLHPSNVLTGRGLTFYDWGDSVVAHPFASMLVALGSLQGNHLGVSVDAPEIHKLRDAYLEVFSDLAPHAELVETLELACRVGKAARALTWHRAVRAQGFDEAGEFASAPLECVGALPDESYLTGG